MIDLKSVLGNAALVVIDVQKGIVGLDRKLEPHSPAEVVANVSKLVEKFRKVGSPVFLVHVNSIDGKDMLHPILDQPPLWASAQKSMDWAEFAEEIKPVSGDIVITKHQWGGILRY